MIDTVMNCYKVKNEDLPKATKAMNYYCGIENTKVKNIIVGKDTSIVVVAETNASWAKRDWDKFIIND